MADEKAKGDRNFDAVVVGAGFAGMYMLYRLRGMGLKVRVYEIGDGVGGTWYWNRYPGARCDTESMEYSYQFSEELQQEWEWSEKYATQPEILRYANHVADRFDLRRDIQFKTRVEAAHFDDAQRRWTVTTDAGDRVTASYFILATGCLSATNLPRFEGMDDFRGQTYHTGRWPHEGVDFTGKRVAVIGTGSSAIQSIPIIAEQASHLYVFQRTPNYAVPAHNAPLDPAEVARIKAEYPEFRKRNKQFPFGFYYKRNDRSALEVTPEERERVYEEGWKVGGLQFMGVFKDIFLNAEANATARDFLARKIRSIVRDPKVAELLIPDTYVGCKRLCVDTGYFETFNRPNVTLVDVRDRPIERITTAGVQAHGREYAVDAIVFATGFDAMTGAALRIDIRGRRGRTLREHWAEGPRTYLGLSTAGFPNMFTITGPGSPSVLTNMLPSIEQHVEWIADCIAHLREHGYAAIEPTVEAQERWVEHVNAVADQTLFRTCNSWYLGANVPGKPRVFMPLFGFPQYVKKCEEVVANGYEGFVMERVPELAAEPA